MDLEKILEGVDYRIIQGHHQVNIKQITNNSEQVQPGDLFICIAGFKHDGHQFIPKAVEAGAAAVLVEKEVTCPAQVTVVQVPDTRAVQGQLISRLLGDPSAKLKVVGVTGTNGKTTITYLIETILKATGKKTGLIGTVENRLGNVSLPATNTTPDALQLQRLLYRMVQRGITEAVVEVSSHGIAQHRLAGCAFDAAILSNVTHDHLDFHQNLLNYRQTKVSFFKQLMQQHKIPLAGIINLDDPSSPHFTKVLRDKLLTYGIRSPEAAVQASAVTYQSGGMTLEVLTPDDQETFFLPLDGLHNVYNLLAAVSYGYLRKIPLADMARAVADFPGVPGRLEPVQAGQKFDIIIDYAHNPDGLKQVLLTLCRRTRGKLITVFGCEGDRDRVKRPLMGQLAVKLSDFVIVTSDNLRFEPPENILADILPGLRGYEDKYAIILDRAEAIRTALYMARPGDLVLIAGKGHEQVQVIGNTLLPFNDRETTLQVLAEMHLSGRLPTPVLANSLSLGGIYD